MTSAPAPVSEVRVPVLSAWWVLIAGVVGLAASMTLTVEKIELLINPALRAVLQHQPGRCRAVR